LSLSAGRAPALAEKTGNDKQSIKSAIGRGLKRIRTCGLAIGSGMISVQKIRREDWAESWKRHFRPIDIGSALLLKPSWSRRRAKRNQALVILDPGLSFGTGQHPTTRFCLEQIVAFRRSDRAQSFLDLGTGSGILAIAAAKLGYRPVRGIDFDRDAVRIAAANAKRNHAKIRLSCQDLRRLKLTWSEKYDLVCANLVFDLLLDERRRILTLLEPAGALILAGILRSQFGDVARAYQESGTKLAALKVEGEWASGVFVFVEPTE